MNIVGKKERLNFVEEQKRAEAEAKALKERILAKRQTAKTRFGSNPVMEAQPPKAESQLPEDKERTEI